MADGTSEEFDWDSLEDGGDTGSNKSFADLRKYAKRMEREVKEAKAANETLTAFQAEVLAERKAAALDTVFKEVGLSPKHAALFAKVNPDAEPTADAVKAFAAEYELATVQGEAVEAPEPEAEGLTPIVKGSAPTGAASGNKVTAADWLKMQATDPVKAKRLFDGGLVDMESAAPQNHLYHDVVSPSR
jgi:hypothetical protein